MLLNLLHINLKYSLCRLQCTHSQRLSLWQSCWFLLLQQTFWFMWGLRSLTLLEPSQHISYKDRMRSQLSSQRYLFFFSFGWVNYEMILKVLNLLIIIIENCLYHKSFLILFRVKKGKNMFLFIHDIIGLIWVVSVMYDTISYFALVWQILDLPSRR